VSFRFCFQKSPASVNGIDHRIEGTSCRYCIFQLAMQPLGTRMSPIGLLSYVHCFGSTMYKLRRETRNAELNTRIWSLCKTKKGARSQDLCDNKWCAAACPTLDLEALMHSPSDYHEKAFDHHLGLSLPHLRGVSVLQS
jgi:hypothetical protein